MLAARRNHDRNCHIESLQTFLTALIARVRTGAISNEAGRLRVLITRNVGPGDFWETRSG